MITILRYSIKVLLLLACFLYLVGDGVEKYKSTLFNNWVHERIQLNDWYYVYSLAKIHNNHELSKRLANEIIRISDEINVDSYLIARQCYKESFMIHWKRSYRNGKPLAWGLFMIQPKYWSHLLYTIQDNSLGAYLMNNPHKNPNKYLLRIGYNIDVYSIVFKYYIDMFNGDLGKAYTAYYAGENSKEMKRYLKGKSNHYVDDILNGNIENKIKTVNGNKWHYHKNKFDIAYIKKLQRT